MNLMRGMRNAFFPSVILWALMAYAAFGQSVQQSGAITPNTSPIWSSTGVIKGGNTANDSPLTTFGVTRDAVDAFCVSSARSTAVGRNQLCLQAATNGPAKISLQNYGTATAQDLEFVLNGVPLILPSGGGTFLTGVPPYILGHAMCVNATTGVLQDCGVSIAAGNLGGVPTYSATGALTSTPTPSAGQTLLGQVGAGAAFVSLSGDVSTVAANGTLTLNKVNGIPFNSSYSAHGVLLGEGSSAFGTVTTPSIGQCLLSQGASSDPIWSSCASGAGSAGGSNTQVQFNNATALGGSVNMTWVSPALTLGVAGTTTGQLALAPVAGVSGTVTVQNPSATSAYNFNLPTAAGSLGQPLLSGGGGATAMSFGTLGVVGGGTNCSAATGTCLDNITGFASTGYVNRTGAGTYAFSLTIPAGNGGTGLASGTSGGILGFTGASTIASSALLAQNGIMIGGGAGATPTTVTACTNGQLPVGATSAAPACQTLSGDISAVTSGGAVTIANSAITVAKQANAAAYSLGGNFTGSPAAPQYSTIGTLTQKASPAASDLVMIQDQAASGQLKYATVSSVSSAGSVASIAGNTGAFTLTGGISNETNAIETSVTPNAQVGTSYAILNGDRAKLITATNAAAQAYTIAQAGTGGNFLTGWYVDIQNNSTNPSGIITITATTSTINFNGVSATTFKIFPGQSTRLVSDGTNYQALNHALTNQTLQASPSNPVASTTPGGVMMGLGSTCVITPTYGTRLKVEFYGDVTSSVTSASQTIALRSGTGTVPLNGATPSGSVLGSSLTAQVQTAAWITPFALGGIITALTPGTAVWLDLSLGPSSGTSTLTNLSCNAMEF